MIEFKNSELQKIKSTSFGSNIVYIKRDDLLHPEVSGNKGRKLKGSLEKLKKSKAKGFLTYGGAYSNHLVAVAALGQIHGFKTQGIVRGDELTSDSNSTLMKCKAFGMKLHFVSRELYRKYSQSTEWPKDCLTFDQEWLIIPEGARGELGQHGCQAIALEVINELGFIEPIHFIVSAGTGTTALGLIEGIRSQDKVTIVNALKGNFLEDEIIAQIQKDKLSQVAFLTQYTFGGYAKFNTELIQFINSFYTNTKIPLEPIYEGKMMFALMDQIKKGQLQNENIVVIHSGGLQGIHGFNERNGTLIKVT